MFKTKSGKAYGSAYVAKRKDAMDAEKESTGPKNNPFAKASADPALGGAQHEAKESPEFSKGEAEGAQEGQESPEQVVAEKGPAHSVTIHHGTGKSKVISHHPGGHMHESSYQTPGEAHEAGKTLAGVGQENPEEAQGAGAGAGAPEPDGFSMPQL